MATPVYTLELYDRANGVVQSLSGLASAAKGTYMLNRPTTWECSIPVFQAYGDSGDGFPNVCALRRCLRVYRTPSTGGDPELIFNGLVLQPSVPMGQPKRFTVRAVDPMWWWTRRPVRDADGSLVNPTFADPITAAGILLAALTNSISNTGSAGNQEGPLGLLVDSGNFDTDTGEFASVAASLLDWPMMISELAGLITASGKLDIRINPVAGSPYDDDIMGVVEARESIGVDRTGGDEPVHFQYGLGTSNVADASYEEDGSIVCNKLWDYFGPKADDGEHWKGLITADDSELPNPPQDDLNDIIAASRAALGTFMDIRFFDVPGPFDPDPMHISPFRKLFERLWQTESLLRSKPRELYRFLPTPECPFRPFEHYREGDLVLSSADVSQLGRGLSGVTQRVYGFTVGPDDKTGAEIVSSLALSADQETG